MAPRSPKGVPKGCPGNPRGPKERSRNESKNKTTKREHRVDDFWSFWAKRGSILVTPFFEFGPRFPKWAPDESIRALVGSPGWLWRLKKLFLEGARNGVENEAEKGAPKGWILRAGTFKTMLIP